MLVRFRCIWLMMVLSTAVCACAIHPAIDDVTSYNAFDVVKKTRCEAQEALRLKLTQYLRRLEGNSAAQTIASELEADPAALPRSKVNLRTLPADVRDLIDRVGRSAVAFDFSLNITENNNTNGRLTIGQLITPGVGTLGLSAGLDRTRSNISTFLVTDTFISLLSIHPEYCYKFAQATNTLHKIDLRNQKYIYPIIGNIGIYKSIDVFVNMSLFGNLTGRDKGPPTMSDALEFTTRFSASANPSLTFIPSLPGAALTEIFFVGSSYREDKHKVIVGLSVPPDDPKVLDATDVFAGPLVNVSTRATPAEVRAATAVSQHILRYEVGQRNSAPVVVQSIIPFL